MTLAIAIVGLILIGCMFAWALVHGGRSRDDRDYANALHRFSDDGGRPSLPYRPIQKLPEAKDPKQ